ncbi:tudor and KH domain-containing protein homolog [Topomyia yanbarensis]|uniref:tudor and KH domain-containing protein homolog n=1 Tax=Topomyia yanbarensis TaxID=2498891 RepID=UPI00273C3C32|nr:tudor and KH domain-containing protein homolog [Topomyia yanbarensis]
MKTPATIPIILGLSLLSVGGACVYAFLKKKKDPVDDASSEDGFSKIAKLMRMMSREEIKVIEITLSNKIVPLVIGRKSCTLQHIQNSTRTEITFREKDELHQVCEIRGTETGIREAEELIMKEATRQIIFTEEVLVPQTACGKILGRCGDALQEICRKSMAKVWIEGTRTLGESRRIMITGTENQISVAKSLIDQKVKDDTDLRRSQEHLEIRREPRIRTPPGSVTATPTPREVLPPTVEKLKTTNSSGQLEVFVSAVVSPSRFYLQLIGPQSTELDILVEAMTEYYNQQESRELHQIRKPYLGQIVAAEYNADSKWYRAEIVAILPNEFKPGEIVLDLYFVDYGDNQYIQPSEVYELRPDFLALRFQAIECFLAQVEPNNTVTSTTGEDQWEPTAISRFEELTHVAQWKKLLSRISTYKNKGHRGAREGREGSPIPGVELYDTTPDGADINIALELVNEGHAKTTMNFGDLNRSHVLRLDGGSQTSSFERLNDLSSESTTGSISSIVSTINISRKTLQQSANEEPTSTDSFSTVLPEFTATSSTEHEKSEDGSANQTEPTSSCLADSSDAIKKDIAFNNILQAENTSLCLKNDSSNSVTTNSRNNDTINSNGLHSLDCNEFVK